jgi:endo-1,4-beta-xylanase
MVTIAPSRRSGLARAGMRFALALALAASCSSKSSSSANNADASADGADAGDAAPPSCGVPTSFAWNSSGVLLSPVSDATHSLTAIKDPSVVYFDNKWHVFASSVNSAGAYSVVYMSFPDWDHTADATFDYLDTASGLSGYKAAPQVFYFAPQNKWYLVYQTGPPSYSTNDDINDPTGWTAAQNFYAAEPDTVRINKGTGGWLDFWVICDDASCFLFFSDDFGHWYRSQTTIDQFPKGFGEPTIVMSDRVASHLFEASNVYKMKDTGKYLALVEAYDASSLYHRYFRSWTADTLDGDWTPLQDTFAAPFASTTNVTFTEQPPWTADISHGEMIRDGYDQQLEIDTCHLRYLYQGLDPTMTGLSYNSLPWRLALLTAAP